MPPIEPERSTLTGEYGGAAPAACSRWPARPKGTRAGPGPPVRADDNAPAAGGTPQAARPAT